MYMYRSALCPVCYREILLTEVLLCMYLYFQFSTVQVYNVLHFTFSLSLLLMKGLPGQWLEVLIVPSTLTLPLPPLSPLTLAQPVSTVSSQPRAVSSHITYPTKPSHSLLTLTTTQSIAALETSPPHSVALGKAVTVSGESVMT